MLSDPAGSQRSIVVKQWCSFSGSSVQCLSSAQDQEQNFFHGYAERGDSHSLHLKKTLHSLETYLICFNLFLLVSKNSV